ncbi:MAG: T9SS type A sorting domain-containing protein [Dysgonamonadaceae bacterium]|jgi:hypothetical protein|nr:T9SS type A sorting domain-containing protein [Dysgonamonadaceae bacterium]
MKKIVLFLMFILFVAFKINAQTASINGEKYVCPDQYYPYIYSLSEPVTSLTKVSISIYDGIEARGSSNFDYFMYEGDQEIILYIKWYDNGIVYFLSDNSSNSFDTELNILDKTKVSSVLIASGVGTPIHDNTINISYGETGTITLEAGETKYPNGSLVSQFDWQHGAYNVSNKYYSFSYGISDRHGETITVTPIGNLCGHNTGLPTTITIKRTFNGKITLNSGNQICINENATYTINNLPSAALVYWSSNEKLTLISSQGNTNAIFKGLGNGRGIVTAMIVIGDYTTTIENNEVWVGVPSTPMITIPSGTMYPSTYYQASANSSFGNPNGYEWSSEGYCFFVGSTTGKNVTFCPGGSLIPTDVVTLFAKSTNSCGTSQMGSISFNVSNDNSDFLKSTNINNSMRLENNHIDDSEYLLLKIYTIAGSLVYSTYNVSKNFDIKSANLPNGIYIIEKITENGKIIREKVILKNR